MMNQQWQKIPTIEEIYNEFHKQTWFVKNGIYPRKIKNFDNVLKDSNKTEFLLRFQNMLKRNSSLIDWKLYIYANAFILKQSFTLKDLGTLASNKRYREYVKIQNKGLNNETEIYDKIVSSLKFLNLYLTSNNFTFTQYLQENTDLIPDALKHVYAGTISLYFYACFSRQFLSTTFQKYSEDIFFEFFDMSRLDFINNIMVQQLNILKFSKIKTIIAKLEQKYC